MTDDMVVGEGVGKKRKPEEYLEKKDGDDEEVSSVLDAMKEFGISKTDHEKQKKMLRAFLKKNSKADDDDDEETEEEDDDGEREETFSSPFVVYIDLEKRGDEIFHDMEAAREMFPLPKLEATSLYMSAVDQNVLTQLTLPLLPYATPTPPLLLMLTGKKLPLYSNSFDLLIEYSSIIKYVVQHDRIRSRRRILQEELLRLNEQAKLTRAHIENCWDAYLAYYRTKNNLKDEPAVYRDRLIIPLPPVDDLEEAVVRRSEIKKKTGDDDNEQQQTTTAIVPVGQKKKATITTGDGGNNVLTSEIEIDPEAKSADLTLTTFYARLRRDRSVPRMWIYRFVKLLPRAVAVGDSEKIYCDDILEDMFIQQHLYMEQMENGVSSFLRSPLASEVEGGGDDDDEFGKLKFSRFVSELNREMTIRLVRLREVTLLRMLSECVANDDRAPIVKSDAVMQWLAPLDVPCPIMENETGDNNCSPALFYMMSPAQVKHIALYRRLFVEKRRELILDRTIIRDQYKRATEHIIVGGDQAEFVLPETPWTLEEHEAASLVRFLGRSYQNNAHREAILHRAHTLFAPAFIEWHSPQTNRMLINTANHLVKTNRRDDGVNMLIDDDTVISSST